MYRVVERKQGNKYGKTKKIKIVSCLKIFENREFASINHDEHYRAIVYFARGTCRNVSHSLIALLYYKSLI